jgi:parvulin-like peptidyl-prolyl isomerase
MIGTEEGAAESEKEAALARARELRAQLKDGGDAPVLFDRLMAEESADPGSAAYPNGYLFRPGEMVEPFETGTKELEMGEISDPVESSFGYHIILRLDPMDDPEELDAMMEEERKDAAMNEKLNLWMTEAVVEETQEYKDLNVETYITNLYALRDEINAADVDAQEDTENTTEE